MVLPAIWALALAVHGAASLALAIGWVRALRLQPTPVKPQPISLVVCLRNEAHNLPALREALSTLSPAPHEILLVDDRSTDATPQLLAQWAAADPRVRHLRLNHTPPGWSAKKYALQCAIEAATCDVLALTDADCRPQPHWLNNLPLTHADVVLGYAPYAPAPSLLNTLVRYETLHTAFMYFAAAGLGQPYLGVGRNLVYRKAWFMQGGGFGPHAARRSGDDDLLINRLATGRRTAWRLTPESFVPSAAPTTWAAWFRQKLRHLSAGGAYSRRSRLLLGAYHGGQTIFYGLGAVLAGLGRPEILPIFAGYWLLRWGLMAIVARRLREQRLWRVLPLTDGLLFLYHLTMAPLGLILKPKWK